MGKHYVLARTIADEHAPRAGMVFSHALIASLEDMVAFGDLRRLVGLLLTEPSPVTTLTPIAIDQKIAQARAKGTTFGRPKSAAKKTAEIRRLYRKEKLSKSEIARRLGIGRTSVRRLLENS